MDIKFFGYSGELKIGNETYKATLRTFQDVISDKSNYEYIDSRDGGWDGNTIFKLRNKTTNEVFECHGYWSLHSVVTIHINMPVKGE